jgi:hypothetical protein
MKDNNGSEDFKVSTQQLSALFEQFNKVHNFETKVKQYKETPAHITREQVERTNVAREFHNAKIESKHAYTFGDKVNVVLKRMPIKKGRIQKWSDGTYKIIDRIGNHYLLSPMHFEFKTYTTDY